MTEKKKVEDRIDDKLLNVTQVTKQLAISHETVIRLIYFKHLAAMDVGIGTRRHWRIWQSDVFRFLESRLSKTVKRQSDSKRLPKSVLLKEAEYVEKSLKRDMVKLTAELAEIKKRKR